MNKIVTKDPHSNEWLFPNNAYILSETDEKGIILYANDIFCDIAGFKIEELIGQPHNIIRHPDMPRIAFKGLWDDIQTKGFWTGIVKNLRKDGGYYWVYATVLKRVLPDGTVRYLSVRTLPSRAEIDAVIPLYAELCAAE